MTSTLALLAALALPCIVDDEALAAPAAKPASAKAEGRADKPAAAKETSSDKPGKQAEGRGKDAKDAAAPSAHKAHGKGAKKGHRHAATADKAAGGKKAKKVASRANGGATSGATKAASFKPAADKTSGATKAASFKPAADKPANDKPAAGKGSKKKSAAKKADAETPRPACHPTTVAIDRNGLEGETFSLVDCKGAPLDAGRVHLSVLARPWGTQRPAAPVMAKLAKKLQAPPPKPKKGQSAPAPVTEVAPNVRLLDPGLLSRLDAIAKHFPGKAVSLVSGYRPQSRGSLHQAARALDMRVAGVANEELVAFCKTLKDTGCGYYPNSSFVHVDVRLPGTGSVSWIDASGPGETPRYVTQWPPPPEPAPAEASKSPAGNAPPVVPPAGDINDETARSADAASRKDHAEPLPENDPRDEVLEAQLKAGKPEAPQKADKPEARPKEKDKGEAKDAPAKPEAKPADAPASAGQGKPGAAPSRSE